MAINNNYSPQCRWLVVDICRAVNQKNSRTIKHKNDDFLMIYCCQLLQFWCAITNGHRIFLPTNKAFEGICLVLVGKFLQKEL